MSAGRRSAREDALRRCFELPWRDQYELWRVLGSYLEAGGAKETKVAKQLRDRAEALDCLERAAGHLNLAHGEAPTIEQYEQARASIGLPLSRRQIELRWDGWHFAKLALAGERTVESSGQRSMRRAATGRRRSHEDRLTGVREWLATKPASTTKPDYDQWAASRNERSGRRAVVRSSAVMHGLGLPWSWVLRVAEFEFELDDAQRRYLEELTAASGSLGLIGLAGIALVCGVGRTYATALVRQPGFPPRVAVIARTPAWYRSDVEAHHAGRKVPRRRVGELQERLVDSVEVSRRTGIKPASLVAGIHRREPWAPQPSGSVSGASFWLRDEFEAWLVQYQERRRGPGSRDAKGRAKGV